MVDQQRNSTPTRPGPSRPLRRPRRTVGAALVAAVALVATGCTSDWDAAPVFDPVVGAVGVSTLRPVADCGDLADGTRAALETAVASMWSQPTTEQWSSVDDAAGEVAADGFVGAERQAAASAPATTTAPVADAGSGAGGDAERARNVIGTNTQEVDVDEADIVKTDGERIVTITDGILRVVALDGSPTVDGTLALGDRAATEMFLRGDEAVVIGSTSGMPTPMPGGRGPFGPADSGAMPEPTTVPGRDDSIEPAEPTDPPETTTPPAPTAPPEPTRPPETTVPGPPTTIYRPEPVPFPTGTTITVVSLEDPAAPSVTESTSVEGGYVSARMVDGTVRLVVRGEPAVMSDVMYAPDEPSARAAVAAIDGEDLLPRAVTDGRVESLGGCDDVLLLTSEQATDSSSDRSSASARRDIAVEPSAGSFSTPAISTITALTVGDSLDELQPVTVQGNAETVYASTDALYVTASGWDEQGSRTDVHRFALPADGPANHTGSGRAPGRLLNQFSLSERDGALRVVTTVDSMSSGTAGRLTVLDTEGDTLDEIGSLDGLGPGEEVKSVRFVGDLGYVVTFRTTDPLYALDLADPRAPKLLGELKIPGFSEYLHPVSEGLLLGVGREADPQTGMDTGFKLSLFDISDPAGMAEVDQIVIPDGWSAVGSDHRAFLWDAGRSQAVIPVERYGANDSPTGGSLVVRIVDGRLQTVADLSHGGAFGEITPVRAFVVDAELWTLSWLALGRTSADSPGAIELVPF